MSIQLCLNETIKITPATITNVSVSFIEYFTNGSYLVGFGKNKTILVDLVSNLTFSLYDYKWVASEDE